MTHSVRTVVFSLAVPTLEAECDQLRVPEQELLLTRPPAPGRKPRTAFRRHTPPDRVPAEHPAAADDTGSRDGLRREQPLYAAMARGRGHALCIVATRHRRNGHLFTQYVRQGIDAGLPLLYQRVPRQVRHSRRVRARVAPDRVPSFSQLANVLFVDKRRMPD